MNTMNTLIYYSFNLMILSAIILIVGSIKPKWLFFWMEKPSRLGAIALAMVVFMIAAVMYGEGNRQLDQSNAARPGVSNVAPAADVPASPIPAPAPDATAPQPPQAEPTAPATPAQAPTQL